MHHGLSTLQYGFVSYIMHNVSYMGLHGLHPAPEPQGEQIDGALDLLEGPLVHVVLAVALLGQALLPEAEVLEAWGCIKMSRV